MNYLGDFAAESTVRGSFNSRDATGAPITLAGTPAISVYKDSGTDESTDGVTLNVDFDGRTGHHVFVVETSADAFFSAGSDYRVVITSGTVDGKSVVGVCVGSFSIENRRMTSTQQIGQALLPAIGLMLDGVDGGGGSGGASAAEIATAVKASLFHADDQTNKLRVFEDGFVNAQVVAIANEASAPLYSGMYGYFTTIAGVGLPNRADAFKADVSGLSGGGDSAATIYTYFTDGVRANAFKATGFAVAGDAMALTTDERNTVAGVIDSRLLNAGDATDLIAGIVARLGTVDIDQTSLVAAIKAALFDEDSIANKLAVSSDGEVTTSVEAVIDINAFAAAVAAALAGTTVVVSSPIFSGEGGVNLEVEQGDHYADQPVRISIESETNYAGMHFVLAAKLNGNGMTLRMLIKSDGEGQYAEFAPSSEQTELWTQGTWDLRHRIELAPNKYRTLKRGILTVRPFDTPATVYEVDPPSGP